jgi:HK97 family phage major capsid protein
MATKRFSLSRMILNSDNQATPEYEDHFRSQRANSAWKEKLGIGGGGNMPDQAEISIPWSRLRRDLTTSTLGSGAATIGLDIPEIQASLRPTSLIMRLPITILDGCQGNVSLPRVSTGATASGLSEIQSFTSADMVFGAAAAGPARISVACTFSRQLLAQAGGSESLDRFLTTELKRALSYQIDSWLLNGSGVNGQPLGIFPKDVTQTFPFTMNTYSGAVTWPKICAIQKSLENAFIDSDSAVWLIGTGTAEKWRQAPRGTSTANFILQDGKVGTIPTYATTYVGTGEQTVLGDWSQWVLAIWGDGVDLVVDRFTKAATGEIVITAALYYQSFIRRPTAFCVSTDTGAV